MQLKDRLTLMDLKDSRRYVSIAEKKDTKGVNKASEDNAKSDIE
jgi:hypothetical protein